MIAKLVALVVCVILLGGVLELGALQDGRSKSEAAKAGKIEGKITRSDLKGKQISNASVSLNTKDRPYSPDAIMKTSTDSEGKYVLNGVAPGIYVISTSVTFDPPCPAKADGGRQVGTAAAGDVTVGSGQTLKRDFDFKCQ